MSRATRVAALIEEFAAISEADSGPGVTRLAFTPRERAAHDLFRREMEALGLTVTGDPAGNTIAEVPGTEPELPGIGVGSHLDTVPNGGAFDGVVGVVGAMVAAEEFVAHPRLRHPVRLVAFSGEEGARFGQACAGSRMAAGQFTRRGLEALRDSAGVSLAEAMRAVGLEPERVDEAAWRGEDWLAFIELHVEQGTVLHNAGTSIGLVDAISGSSRFQLRLSGVASHSGGTPMHLRADAGAGAAEIILAAASIASAVCNRGTRITVGRISLEPGSITTIPGKATLDIDVRDVDDLRQRACADQLIDRAVQIARSRGLGIEVRVLGDVSPALLPIRLRQFTSRAASERGLSYRVMESGASHDSQAINTICPAALVFVPSLNQGVSHAPEELSSYDDIARGIDVLISTIRLLDVEL